MEELRNLSQTICAGFPRIHWTARCIYAYCLPSRTEQADNLGSLSGKTESFCDCRLKDSSLSPNNPDVLCVAIIVYALFVVKLQEFQDFH